MSLNLTDQERHLLREILSVTLSELRLEIGGTDRLDYRDELRSRKIVVEKVIATLDLPTNPPHDHPAAFAAS